MKISKLISILQQTKKEHGDIRVAFDEYTINTRIEENDEDSDYRVDNENCIRPFAIYGVHKISYENTNRRPKTLIFGLDDAVTAFDEKGQ